MYYNNKLNVCIFLKYEENVIYFAKIVAVKFFKNEFDKKRNFLFIMQLQLLAKAGKEGSYN